jgi:Zn-dependent peptidase ImmA (M78 family)
LSARARALAAAFLVQRNVAGPPVPDDLVRLCDPLCVLPANLPVGAVGMLFREPPFGSVIWLRKNETHEERRLALFHHMGHLVLHPDIIFCTMRMIGDLPAEQEADSFATALLMPARWLRRDTAKGGVDVPLLAGRYQVPLHAMAARLREVGLDASA